MSIRPPRPVLPALFTALVAAGAGVHAPALADIVTREEYLVGSQTVSEATQRRLGLVAVGGCSGVMITPVWGLTSGHCWPTTERPPAPPTVTLAGDTVVADRVYLMGGEQDPVTGFGSGRGHDLALFRLPRPLRGAEQVAHVLDGAARLKAGDPLTVYGTGRHLYATPTPPPPGSPPPPAPGWRTATFPAGKAVPLNPGFPVAWSLTLPTMPWGLATPTAPAPGDSGGPVFDKTGALVGVVMRGTYRCLDNSTWQNCKDTITSIDSAQIATIDAATVLGIVGNDWNPDRIAQPMNVTAAEYVPFAYGALDFTSLWKSAWTPATAWHEAARGAASVCFNRGFVSGQHNGYQSGPLVGVTCFGRGFTFRDATPQDRGTTPWPFTDPATVDWARSRRAAMSICQRYDPTAIGGFFNGEASWTAGMASPDGRVVASVVDRTGLVCMGRSAGRFYDLTPNDLAQLGAGGFDVGRARWDEANRIAYAACRARGLEAGFFTGHQVPGKVGLACAGEVPTVRLTPGTGVQVTPKVPPRSLFGG